MSYCLAFASDLPQGQRNPEIPAHAIHSEPSHHPTSFPFRRTIGNDSKCPSSIPLYGGLIPGLVGEKIASDQGLEGRPRLRL